MGATPEALPDRPSDGPGPRASFVSLGIFRPLAQPCILFCTSATGIDCCHLIPHNIVLKEGWTVPNFFKVVLPISLFSKGSLRA